MNSVLDNSPISDGRNNIWSLSNDTWADSIIKQQKTAQLLDPKSAYAKYCPIGYRSHTPTAKDEPVLKETKEDDHSSNYFQKAIKTRVVNKNRNKYSRCYKNRSLSVNKTNSALSPENAITNLENGNSKQVNILFTFLTLKLCFNQIRNIFVQ